MKTAFHASFRRACALYFLFSYYNCHLLDITIADNSTSHLAGAIQLVMDVGDLVPENDNLLWPYISTGRAGAYIQDTWKAYSIYLIVR